MSFITLTTDFGFKDFYVSALKAKIYSLLPEVKLIDISHSIEPFSIKNGVFVLKNVFKEFPIKSIHIFGVNEGGEAPFQDLEFYLAEIEQQYVIGTGKEFLLLFDKAPTSIFKLNKENVNPSFPTFSLFAEVCSQIVKGVPFSDFSTQDELINIQKNKALEQDGAILGNVVYIDSFGNAITNISKELFEKTKGSKSFEISFGRDLVSKINQTYGETPAGDSLCIFNQNEYLEVATSFGSAHKFLGLDVDSKVIIKFS